MRVHVNFAEYVPLALILIMLAELGGASSRILHALGLALLLGRAVHAFGVSQPRKNRRFRVELRPDQPMLRLGDPRAKVGRSVERQTRWRRNEGE